MIAVSNRQRRVSVTAADVRSVVEATYRSEDAGEPRLSVALVNDRTIRELNDEFLGHDYATDALAFSFEDEAHTGARGQGDASGPAAVDADDVAGEVVVSAETAVREATARGTDPRHELLLYIVHGTLHLLGWDDDTPTRRTAMNRRAAAILRGAGVVSGR